jgi:protein-arginine kinase activator protein McsA
MIEPEKQHSCIMCESTQNLTEIEVDESDSVYICQKCSDEGEAYLDRFDQTPF